MKLTCKIAAIALSCSVFVSPALSQSVNSAWTHIVKRNSQTFEMSWCASVGYLFWDDLETYYMFRNQLENQYSKTTVNDALLYTYGWVMSEFSEMAEASQNKNWAINQVKREFMDRCTLLMNREDYNAFIYRHYDNLDTSQ